MNSRNVITRCLDSGGFRDCPVCQHVIDQNHDEALEHHKKLGFHVYSAPLDEDLVTGVELIEVGENEIIAEGDGFAIVENHDPNKTLPPR